MICASCAAPSADAIWCAIASVRPTGGGGLVHEPAQDRRVARELGVQDLDRDLAVDQPVLGEEHAAHAAGRERAHDLVTSVEDVTGLEQLSSQVTRYYSRASIRMR